MNSLTESRRATLVNIAYFAVLIVGFYLFLKYAFWLLSPFIFAFVLAVILQRPVNYLNRKTHVKKGIISVVFVLLFIGIIGGLAVLIGFSAYGEIRDFINYMIGKFNDLPNLLKSLRGIALNLVGFLPESLEKTTSASIQGIYKRLNDYAESGVELNGMLKALGFSFSDISDKITSSSIDIGSIASPIVSTAMKVPSKLISVLIFIIASIFMTSDYNELVNIIKRNSKKETAAKLSTVKRITFTSLKQMCKSYAIIICITFAELFVGLNILRFCGVYDGGYIPLIALCTALLDILPIFGTGTVMIPWAAYNLIIAHNAGMGIGLLILYVMITVIRQVLEPKLVGANLGIHPILTLMGMYVGLETIGVIGMFALPITIVIIKMLNEDGVVHFWGEKRELATEERVSQEKMIKPAVTRIAVGVKRMTRKSAAAGEPEEQTEGEAEAAADAETDENP